MDSTQTGQHWPSCTVERRPGPHSMSGHCASSHGSLQMGQHCQEGVMKSSPPQSGMSHTTPSHDASSIAWAVWYVYAHERNRQSVTTSHQLHKTMYMYILITFTIYPLHSGTLTSMLQYTSSHSFQSLIYMLYNTTWYCIAAKGVVVYDLIVHASVLSLPSHIQMDSHPDWSGRGLAKI